MSRRKNSHGAPGWVIYAKSKKKLSVFYRTTLDLAMVESGTGYDLLAGRGLQIVVHAIPPNVAREIKIARPPELRAEPPSSRRSSSTTSHESARPQSGPAGG